MAAKIQGYLKEIYSVDVSLGLMFDVTDAVLEVKTRLAVELSANNSIISLGAENQTSDLNDQHV